MISPLEIARDALTRRNIQPVLCGYGTKAPLLEGWQHRRYAEADLPHIFNGEKRGVGGLTGEASDGLVDIDLDALEAVQLAPRFLPRTQFRFGRRGKRNSHLGYRPDPLPRTRRFEDPDPADDDRAMILEVLSDGRQVILPGNDWVSKVTDEVEAIEWEEDGEPARVDGDDLIARCGQLAAAALLARHWPKEGSRQNAALALCGGLARAGWDEKQIGLFVHAIAEAAGDDEVRKRVDCALDTVERLKAGNHVTEWPTLVELLGTNGKQVVARFCEWLGIDARRDGDLPQILAAERPLRHIAADALGALHQANSPATTFVRAGTLARVVADEKERPAIQSMGMGELTWRLAQVADFLKPGKYGLSHVPPPERLVQVLLSRGGWPFPALEGVTECPTLRPDGTVLSTPGYDPVTRLIYAPTAGLSLPSVPERPTEDDLGAAVVSVQGLLQDFPFVMDGGEKVSASYANTFAALLTPILRPAISGPVPLGVFDKPAAGTGGTLLCEVIATIATGRDAAMMTAPVKEEEWGKQITACLLAGAAILIIDNLNAVLASAKLASVLTSLAWNDRRLGRSEQLNLPHRAIWYCTGNNVRIGGDLPRRCYWIRMDAKSARPWMGRKFRHMDLLDHVRSHRGELLAALLTIARAWFAAGQPVPAETPILGKFEDWCRMLGGVLHHADVAGFLGNLPDFYDRTDDEALQWDEFLQALKEAFNGGFTTAVLSEGLAENAFLRTRLPEELAEVTRGEAGGFQKRLGNALRKREGVRHLSGVHLEREESKRHGAVVWLVKQD
jgi:hypothetical protein